MDTPMISGYVEAYDEELLEETMAMTGPANVMEPGKMLQPTETSEAYMWLSSDTARYITGTTLKVNAGMTAK